MPPAEFPLKLSLPWRFGRLLQLATCCGGSWIGGGCGRTVYVRVGKAALILGDAGGAGDPVAPADAARLVPGMEGLGWSQPRCFCSSGWWWCCCCCIVPCSCGRGCGLGGNCCSRGICCSPPAVTPVGRAAPPPCANCLLCTSLLSMCRRKRT